MRIKRILSFVLLLVIFTAFYSSAYSFAVPRLRRWLVQKIPATEFDRIVLEAYPSFDLADYDPVIPMYFDDGDLGLAYELSSESDTPIYFDEYGNSNLFEFFVYDCFWRQVRKLD